MHAELKKDDASLQNKSSDTHQENKSQVNRDSDLLSGETTEGFTRSPSHALPPTGQGQLVMQCKDLSENPEPTQKSGQLIQRRVNNTGLPDRLKTGIENLSGMDMSDVRVHRNSSKPREIGALAYTQGTDIHLGPGQNKHLPHEAWHVAQQKQGRVPVTTQFKGLAGNDDSSLEKEADQMGAAALRMQSHDTAQAPLQSTAVAGDTIQREVGFEFEINPSVTTYKRELQNEPQNEPQLAFTQGTHVYFGPAQYQPRTPRGQGILGHELAHVVQQADGRVRPTGRVNGLRLNEDPRLEREADDLGAAAARGASSHHTNGQVVTGGTPLRALPASAGSVVQRIVVPRTVANNNATTQELESAYDAAWQHLWQSDHAKFLYSMLHAHWNNIYVDIGANNTVTGAPNPDWVISWDPWQYGVFVNQPRNALVPNVQAGSYDRGTISAAMLLLHEFGHVKQDIETWAFAGGQGSAAYIPGQMNFAFGVGRNDMESWLRRVHVEFTWVYPRLHPGLPVPQLPDPHNVVMEDDNLTRHERPAQVALTEPVRHEYHNAVSHADLSQVQQFRMFFSGLGPAVTGANLAASVTTTVQLPPANPAVPQNANTILTHLQWLRQQLGPNPLQFPPFPNGSLGLQGNLASNEARVRYLVSELDFAITHWTLQAQSDNANRQAIANAQPNQFPRAAGAAPTFAAP